MEAELIDYTGLFVKVCVALVLVIILAGVFIKYVLPRMKGFRHVSKSGIEILDRQSLEPRKHIYLVKAGERHLLVGTADQSASLLGELSKDEVEKMYS